MPICRAVVRDQSARCPAAARFMSASNSRSICRSTAPVSPSSAPNQKSSSTSQRLGALECVCEPEAPDVLDPRVNWIGFFGHGSATLTLWTEPLNRRMRILAHACTPVLTVSA